MQPRFDSTSIATHDSKSHIDSLMERRNAITDNTTTVANMISQQMHQLFHDPKSFMYEIIQNA